MNANSLKQPSGVAKNTYNHAYMELMEKFRLMDQRISTKADDVVLTMALEHRKEIENMQKEINQVRKDLEQLRQLNDNHTVTTIIPKQKRNKNWFKLLPFTQRS
ncbi:hypothetical protein GCM10011351_06230 [Paraliobacillus quinghaiensis]|uniref:Uncharacterized protein n=1 Tax=Paraliobacillus quinghaiensis TaxID=470815 RepID=A0A917THI3_9BACI|nr:hypothetical protein [Paraliobacillus quinghaiensis]GGM23134.1 hypothetical protein GCM10011351_06230 [Paraliobacillus quinghaiensis]